MSHDTHTHPLTASDRQTTNKLLFDEAEANLLKTLVSMKRIPGESCVSCLVAVTWTRCKVGEDEAAVQHRGEEAHPARLLRHLLHVHDDGLVLGNDELALEDVAVVARHPRFRSLHTGRCHRFRKSPSTYDH